LKILRLSIIGGIGIVIVGAVLIFLIQPQTREYHTSLPTLSLYPQTATGIDVLYMPLNSTGIIHVQYSNPNPPTTVGMRIFEVNHALQKPRHITFWPNNQTIPTGNSTIVYTIQTENVAGFYGVILSCGGMPLAVGYDNDSRIVSGDFPWLGVTYCPNSGNYDFHITGTNGIGVKLIPYP